jgi:hypothetical protein
MMNDIDYGRRIPDDGKVQQTHLNWNSIPVIAEHHVVVPDLENCEFFETSQV